MDFTGNDLIVFQNLSGIVTVSDALSHPTQLGDDLLFNFGPADSLILHGVDLATLAPDILVT